MIKDICQWVLYKHLGWKKDITVGHPKKFIICLTPHTSNWDFIIGLLFSRAEGIKSNFLMKKEWFFWPLESHLPEAGRCAGMEKQAYEHDRQSCRDCPQARFLRPLHHARGDPFAQSGMEEGFLLHRPEGWHPYPPLRSGLREEAHPVYQGHHPFGRCGEGHEGNQALLQGFQGKKPEKFTIGNID